MSRDPNVRIYVITPTPSPKDVSIPEIREFVKRWNYLISKDRAMKSNMVLVKYGFNEDDEVQRSLIKWNNDRVHPAHDCSYTNVFMWEWLNAISSFAEQKTLGRRPFGESEKPLEGWTKALKLEKSSVRK